MPSPAKTTVRVAVTNNAAKDDSFQDLDWLQEDASLQGSLNVLANDPGSARIIGVSQNLPAGSGDLLNNGSSFTPAGFSGALSVSINQTTGQLDIDASALNAELQSLGEGEARAITFYYTAQMANGAYSTAKVTIEIEGTNDDPVFSASSVLAGTIDDSPADDAFSTVTGTVAATDVDANDAGLLTFALAEGEDGSSDFGTFAIDADGDWTFTPDDAAVEGLKATEVLTFGITVSDGHGGSASETVTITLNGVNDIAEIAGDAAGAVAEDGTLAASGALGVADRDVGDVGFQAADAGDLAGTYGDFTFDEGTGGWTYTLRNDDAAVQDLDGDDTVFDTLTVWSVDGSASETITVSVQGAEDGPPPFVYDAPEPFTGTGDPNDFDNLGNAAGENLSSQATNRPNTIYGGAGDDTINGGGGGDTLYGGSGGDALGGGNQGDTLYGGSGSDTLMGGNDDDIIVGGFGADSLAGNGGDDTFVYLGAADTGDAISDFAAGDTIDLAALGVTGFAGAIAEAGAVGSHQVGFMTSAGVTTLYVDIDGVFGADLEIALTNGYAPASSDFLFQV